MDGNVHKFHRGAHIFAGVELLEGFFHRGFLRGDLTGALRETGVFVLFIGNYFLDYVKFFIIHKKTEKLWNEYSDIV